MRLHFKCTAVDFTKWPELTAHVTVLDSVSNDQRWQFEAMVQLTSLIQGMLRDRYREALEEIVQLQIEDDAGLAQYDSVYYADVLDKAQEIAEKALCRKKEEA
jgi:hypothetical protein